MSSSLARGVRVLPPGLSENQFDRALDIACRAIGSQNVSRDASHGSLPGPHGQTAYGDIYSTRTEDNHKPSAAFRPQTVPELQALLKIANEFCIPLWTISRGKNLGYGGTSPIVEGSVVLDLHRMNKIIKVDEEHAYAVVEPGVSFFDLYEYIKEHKYNLWMSVPALGWGSIIGNTTERGFGYTPNGVHEENQCGMEVVLPSGEILRTGMWAMDGNPTAHLFKGGFGPSIDGLFTQSNLGVVTKMGVNLMHAPKYFMDCEVSVPNEDQLGLLVGKLSFLERNRHIENHISVANLWRQCTVSQQPDIYARIGFPGSASADPKVLAEIQKEQGWGYWKGYFAVYGPKEVCEANWNCIQKEFEDVPGAQFSAIRHEGKNKRPLLAGDVPEADIPHQGLPTLAPLPIMDIRGKFGGHLDFSPVFPSGGKDLQKWYDGAAKRFKEAGIDFWSDFHVWGRYTIAIIVIIFGPHEKEPTEALFQKLLEDGEKMNVTEYRTHLDYMDHVAGLFNFNGGSLGKFTQSLKDQIDPNGILSAGKSGIWNSKRLRPKRSTANL